MQKSPLQYGNISFLHTFSRRITYQKKEEKKYLWENPFNRIIKNVRQTSVSKQYFLSISITRAFPATEKNIFKLVRNSSLRYGKK